MAHRIEVALLKDAFRRTAEEAPLRPAAVVNSQEALAIDKPPLRRLGNEMSPSR